MNEVVEGCVNKGCGWVCLLLAEVAGSRCWHCCSYVGYDFFWRYSGFSHVVMDGKGRWHEWSWVRWMWWIWGSEKDFGGRRSWKTVVNGGCCVEAWWFLGVCWKQKERRRNVRVVVGYCWCNDLEVTGEIERRRRVLAGKERRWAGDVVADAAKWVDSKNKMEWTFVKKKRCGSIHREFLWERWVLLLGFQKGNEKTFFFLFVSFQAALFWISPSIFFSSWYDVCGYVNGELLKFDNPFPWCQLIWPL